MRVRDDQKKDLIFKASLRVIRDNGMVGTTMAKISKEAGIATGTVYIYFKNKEELINSLYLSLRNKSLTRFMSKYNPDKPFEEGLKKVWMNYLKHRIEYHDESIFLEQYYHSAYITKEQKQSAKELKTPVLDLIQKGKTENMVREDVDNEMIFSSLIGFIRELSDEHVAKNYILNQTKLENAFHLAWDSIKK